MKELPKSIENKIRRMINYGQKSRSLEAEVYGWFEAEGIDIQHNNDPTVTGNFDFTINDEIQDTIRDGTDVEDSIKKIKKYYRELQE